MRDEQNRIVDLLARKGWTVNDADSESVYMSKRKGPRTLYAQVEQDGSINGLGINDFLAWARNAG